MAYIALYRKWRPQTFDEVVEQDSVVSILKNTVMTRRIAHAYLFCGTRGTGKTTLAKIFAKAINCKNPQDGNPCNTCEICRGINSGSILDVSEIDAASNNGVDNIRSIIDESVYSAAQAEYRVYIIDEVHMLSTGAFNALLKTLEEPPRNVVFILCTTEPHKLPVTILSRCQRYDFKRISRDGIVSRLEEICQSLDTEYEIPALQFIAQKADGALRDAISLLDQTIASCDGKITIGAARSASGSLDRASVEDFTEKLLQSDGVTLLQYTDKIFADGRDPSNFIGEIMGILRDIMVTLTVRNPENLLCENEEGLEKLKQLAANTNIREVSYLIRELSLLDNSLKWAVQRKIIFEAGILKLCDRRTDSNMDFQERVTFLEQRVADLVASGIKLSQARESIAKPTQDTSAPAAEEPPKSRSAAEVPESLEPVTEELDWQDFLSGVSERGKSATAAILRTNSKPYFFKKNTLCLCFEKEQMMRMIDARDLPLLSDAATQAFGRELKVRLTPADKLDSLAAEQNGPEAEYPSAATEEKDDRLIKALDILGQLSEEEGFDINAGE